MTKNVINVSAVEVITEQILRALRGNKCPLVVVFTARRYAERGICYGNSVRPSVCLSVCPSVRPSVTRVDQSKTVEVRIMQFSTHSSPIPLVFVR